jgi:hypothetical protein
MREGEREVSTRAGKAKSFKVEAPNVVVVALKVEVEKEA